MILHTLHFRLFTPHFTLHTAHSHTLHFALYTLDSTLYTVHSTLYALQPPTLHSHFTVHTWHFTLYTPHSTLYSLHFTPHILHSTLCTLHSTLHIFYSTLYTLHSTLYTPFLFSQNYDSGVCYPTCGHSGSWAYLVFSVRPLEPIFIHFRSLAGQLVRSEVMSTLQGDRRGRNLEIWISSPPKPFAFHPETWDLIIIFHKLRKLGCSQNVGVEATGSCVHIQWSELHWSVWKDCHITHQKHLSWRMLTHIFSGCCGWLGWNHVRLSHEAIRTIWSD